MPLSVGIVGCGVGGMAAALFLNRAGHDVAIHERFETPQPLGAGLLLQPTGLAVLDRLGIEETALAHGDTIAALDGRAVGSGRRVMNLHYRRYRSDSFGLGIQRGTLFQILYDAVQAAGIEIRTGAEIAERRDRHLVAADGRRFGPFDLTVAADGSDSALRYEAGKPRVDKPYPWGAFWCLVDDPDRAWSGVLHQRYDGPRRMAGILPVGTLPSDPGGPPKVSFFWSVRADAFDAWTARGITPWHDEMCAYWPEAEPVWGAIRDPAQLARATYRDVVFRTAVAPGLAVIGDAAHAMSPQLGQGANLALVDAMFLGEALAEATPGSLDEGLRAYDRGRRAHVRFYQRASRWLTPLFQSERTFAGWFRDWSFPVAQRLPVMRGEAGALLAGVKGGWLRRIDPERWRGG